MARIANWDCRECKRSWAAPGVGRLNMVITRICPWCGKNTAMAWGRSAREDGRTLEITSEVEVVE